MNLDLSLKNKLAGLDFTKAQVLVVGDVMLDRYWQGETNRISPESPVPVVSIRNITERPGGAGNAALNVNSLGAKATLLANVGQDEAALSLKNMLEEAGVKCCLQHCAYLPTISKLRVLSRNQQLIRLDFEESFYTVNKKHLLANYKLELSKNNIVIISDYNKGISSCITDLIKLANAKKVPVVIDPKSKDFSIYQGATLVKPNWNEFEAVVGNCNCEKIMVEKAYNLIHTHQINAILVTRGANGMDLIQSNGMHLHIPAHAQEIFDVTGAGDTVIAVFASALAVGKDLITAAQIANIAAGIVVMKLGAATVSVPELRRAVQKQNDSWLGIVSQDDLLHEIADAKAHGETIVMTNGCFDILHAGHITYLQQAKALGQRLVVAVNDDDSVRRLKGHKRPINSLEQRMTVLAGIRSVDWVVPFSTDTPEELIKKVKPDFLVKGGDYKTDQIAGSDFVIKNGGKVITFDLVKDCSSTAIVERIKKGAKK